MGDALSELLRQYYRSPSVRERMNEFLGRAPRRTSTATYIVATEGDSGFGARRSPRCLPDWLENGWDVERSLWDSESLIVDLDLDYENFDSAASAYLDPQRAFALLEPVLSATSQTLAETGIEPLVMISGRGFHLVWRISRSSAAFHRLARLGRVPPSLMAAYASSALPTGECVDPELARAFAGLGMVLEFAAHRVLRVAASSCPVSVQVTMIEVGPGANSREIVSLDLSEYGDPFHRRHIRIPFSAYLKPRKLVWALGEERIRRMLPLFEIPLAGMKPVEALAVMRCPDAVKRLSRHVSTVIPDRSDGTMALIEAYQRGELAAFHESFYSMSEEEARGSTAARAKAQERALPLCAKWILDHPNDWLLKPAALQHLARVLTALNWHPRAIAELIRDRYEADFGWGEIWGTLNPSWRATFYTRLFTGLIATGCDQLIDLNCVSHREKGYCTIPECSGNLVAYQNMLRDRRPA